MGFAVIEGSRVRKALIDSLVTTQRLAIISWD